MRWAQAKDLQQLVSECNGPIQGYWQRVLVAVMGPSKSIGSSWLVNAMGPYEGIGSEY